jgi:TolB-like protein/DNA-binding winged helix-turn-helix (wHTH) protein
MDPGRRTLSRADAPVSLTPKAFDVLLFLAQNPHRLVTKEELLQAVWGDTFVEEGNLKQHISHLRKALGDNFEDSNLIVTIARKGYQFTADVTVSEMASTSKQDADPTTESSPTGVTITGDEAVVGAHWRKIALVGLSAIFLLFVFYVSWVAFGGKTPPSSQKVMLAVLPFENLTGDPSKDYLADGLTEETISQLGRLNPDQLGVIARTSVMGYKHKDDRLDQIGRDLSVQYVLENSLRESGNHMRLTVQLIQVKDQSHLWSQEYDYPAKDILNIEAEVGKAVVQQIQLHLTSQQKTALAQPHTVNPEAFDAYLQGHYYFEGDTDKDTEMSAKYFERATQLDPGYALAWVGLSRARKWQAVTGLIPKEEGYRLAREAVERALALNPNLAEAHTQMGRIKQQIDFDWTGADASYRRAVELEPGNPEGLRVAAGLVAYLGRLNEALPLARRAVNLDPLNAGSWDGVGEIEFRAGKLDEAEADLKKAHELRPDYLLSSTFLSEVYVMRGRPQDALPEIERIAYDPIRTFLYAITYHALGRERESDEALKALIAKYQAIDPYLIADIYAFRNQSDEAFVWLDRAYAQRDDSLVFTKVDPLLKSLPSDPRFASLLKKLNLPN